MSRPDTLPPYYHWEQNPFATAATYASTSLWGVQACVSVHAMTRFYHLPLQKRADRIGYVAILALMMALSTLSCVLLLRQPYIPLMDAKSFTSSAMFKTAIESKIASACKITIELVGGAFMIWRASIAWSHNRILRWIPSAVYGAYFGLCVTSIYFQIKSLNRVAEATLVLPSTVQDNLTLDAATFEPFQVAYQWWRAADYGGSVAVSLVATAFIGVRVYLVQGATGSVMGATTILVETGFPSTLIGFAGLFLSGAADDGGRLDPSLREVWRSTYSRALSINCLMHNTWTNTLALGCQVILFQVLSDATWVSNPKSTAQSLPVNATGTP
ncbi:hypothetical protein BKA70DRAFT_1229226 [Coprinopsis sp. MPI-PUGE-AT-0042]|nr:hypothetical protein BKA70DRAFT_1229226 [Coprinopsis sp. MPI-PUGE-AT-0042]